MRRRSLLPFDPDDLRPSRSWDELLDCAVRRGTSIRRRRRATISASIGTVVALAMGLGLAFAGDLREPRGGVGTTGTLGPVPSLSRSPGAHGVSGDASRLPGRTKTKRVVAGRRPAALRPRTRLVMSDSAGDV